MLKIFMEGNPKIHYFLYLFRIRLLNKIKAELEIVTNKKKLSLKALKYNFILLFANKKGL